MTYEEATENLKKLRSFHNGSYGAAVKMAITAIDKQIPKTPLDIRACPNEARFANCPVCGQVVDEWSPYCDQCGQAIDWEA